MPDKTLAKQLLDAADNGDIETVKRIIAQPKSEWQEREAGAIAQAAGRGYLEIVKLFVEKVKMDDLSIATAIDMTLDSYEHAIIRGNLQHSQELQKVLDYFLNKNFINIATIEGKTPLHSAIAKRNLNFATKLLKAGANPNAVNNNGETPILTAIQLFDDISTWAIGFYGVTQQMVNDVLKTGNQYIVTGDSLPFIKLLVSYGADPNKHTNDGWSPLKWAIIHEHIDAVVLFLPYLNKENDQNGEPWYVDQTKNIDPEKYKTIFEVIKKFDETNKIKPSISDSTNHASNLQNDRKLSYKSLFDKNDLITNHTGNYHIKGLGKSGN